MAWRPWRSSTRRFRPRLSSTGTCRSGCAGRGEPHRAPPELGSRRSEAPTCRRRARPRGGQLGRRRLGGVGSRLLAPLVLLVLLLAARVASGAVARTRAGEQRLGGDEVLLAHHLAQVAARGPAEADTMTRFMCSRMRRTTGGSPVPAHDHEHVEFGRVSSISMASMERRTSAELRPRVMVNAARRRGAGAGSGRRPPAGRSRRRTGRWP